MRIVSKLYLKEK